MAILPVRRFPDPSLKNPSRPLEELTSRIRERIEELIETMRFHPRCVGLAAPQVGWNARVAVMDATGHPKAERPHGLLVLMNPEIVARDGQVSQREGCLSVPDLTGNVIRAARVQIRARDRDGDVWMRWLEGFEAIIAQHEIDHLDGTLFLDRVANPKTDLFRRKQYWFPESGKEGRKTA